MSDHEIIPAETTAVATVQTQPGELLTAIVALARDPSFDVAKLQALMAMQQQMEDRQAERSFAAALRLAQAEIPHIAKNGVISLGSGKGAIAFATWPDMDRVLRPVMDRHGFTLTFDMAIRDGGGAVVTGHLTHVDGAKRTASVPLPLDTGPGRNNTQAMGSTFSYGRRYVAEMLFNLVRDGQDDDGASAGKKFITSEQVQEINALMKAAGRLEGPMLDSVFAGSTPPVRSIEEIDAGTGYTVMKNFLSQIIHRQAVLKEQNNA